VRISAALPTGMAALLFDAARRRRALEERMVGELDAAGFSEVILPILDYFDPYEPFLTEGGRGELYRFVDRDGELLTLRADFTPMLARLLAPRLPALDLPLRLFYRGDVVRYQEERAGRQREFYQVGAELLGVEGVEAALEMLRLFLRLLQLGRVRPLRVVLGFAGALDRLLLASGDAAAEVAAAVARRERGPSVGLDPSLRRLVRDGVPADPADLGEPAAGKLILLTAVRDELAAEFPDVELSIDLAEFAPQSLDPDLLAASGARAYYDGVLFRAYAGGRGQPVGAGGRYDRLFRMLGAEVPALGFSVDLERLINGDGRGGDGRGGGADAGSAATAAAEVAR
jgi:ATP phosphoribosyltransferase regulatory subunit